MSSKLEDEIFIEDLKEDLLVDFIDQNNESQAIIYIGEINSSIVEKFSNFKIEVFIFVNDQIVGDIFMKDFSYIDYSNIKFIDNYIGDKPGNKIKWNYFNDSRKNGVNSVSDILKSYPNIYHLKTLEKKILTLSNLIIKNKINFENINLVVNSLMGLDYLINLPEIKNIKTIFIPLSLFKSHEKNKFIEKFLFESNFVLISNFNNFLKFQFNENNYKLIYSNNILKKDKLNLVEKNKNLSSQINKLTKESEKNKNLSSQINQLKKEASEKNKILSSQINEFKKEASEKNKILNSQINQLKKESEKNKILSSQINELKKEASEKNKNLSSQINELKKESEKRLKYNLNLEKVNKDLISKIDLLNLKHENILEINNVYIDEKERLINEIAIKNDLIKEIMNRNKILNSKINELLYKQSEIDISEKKLIEYISITSKKVKLLDELIKN